MLRLYLTNTCRTATLITCSTITCRCKLWFQTVRAADIFSWESYWKFSAETLVGRRRDVVAECWSCCKTVIDNFTTITDPYVFWKIAALWILTIPWLKTCDYISNHIQLSNVCVILGACRRSVVKLQIPIVAKSSLLIRKNSSLFMRYRREEVGLVWVDLKFVTIVNVVTNVGAK